MMADSSEVALLENRDMQLYGNKDGPTFEQLVAQYSKAGFEGDELYLAMIQGAQTTNVAINKRFEN